MSDRRATESETWQALRALVLDRNDSRREVCDVLDLSFVRVKALRRIAAGSITMRDLAAALTTDPPYTTLVVNALERRGLVVRTPHPDDGRVRLVTATVEGRKAARRAEKILATPPAAVRSLAEDDLEALHRITRTMLAGSG